MGKTQLKKKKKRKKVKLNLLDRAKKKRNEHDVARNARLFIYACPYTVACPGLARTWVVGVATTPALFNHIRKNEFPFTTILVGDSRNRHESSVSEVSASFRGN